MPAGQALLLRDYLAKLRETKKGKPPHVREALEVYIDLWDKAVEKGTVSEGDEVDVALSKIDRAGGLYQAAD
ncbi:MAG TPA: hypothetical protein VLU99_02815 [Nitrososphaerales archaeon]|nr:hypothetical protein [Nitrososphaerales archaeon]HUK74698.1 hypothetical protein [Nitrososphaerales archaeon]